MLVVCWSPKGGSGTSVVTTGLALASMRRRPGSSTIIVDLAGDIPAMLSMGDVSVGSSEWITQPASFELSDLLAECAAGLSVLPRGMASLPESRSGAWSRFAAALEGLSRNGATVVVDAGIGPVPDELARIAARIHLIVRPCYLALRRARLMGQTSHSVILVCEQNRVLTSSDVESVLGIPVTARVGVDSDIARRVDAGIIVQRPPTRLMKDLAPVVEEWFRR